MGIKHPARTGRDTLRKTLLPLKSDIVFKMVFGDARYTDITRAFLSAVLDISAEEYEGLEIVDPHTERDRPDDKPLVPEKNWVYNIYELSGKGSGQVMPNALYASFILRTGSVVINSLS